MENIDDLILQAATIAGSLDVESPCALGNTIVRDSCNIGAFTYFNKGTDISDCDIGRYCSIGANVLINPGRHPLGYVTTHPIAYDFSGASAGLGGVASWKAACGTAMSLKSNETRSSRVRIGNDVWIGSNAIILPGVVIATGAVIGAGAVVTKDVAPYSIVAGNPAHHIRFRLPAEQIEALLALAWWNYDLAQLGTRDYSDVAGFIVAMQEKLAAGMDLLRPRVTRIRAGKRVDPEQEIREQIEQKLMAGKFAEARQNVNSGIGSANQVTAALYGRINDELASRNPDNFNQFQPGRKQAVSRDVKTAPHVMAILDMPGGLQFLETFRARFASNMVAPPSVFFPELSTIFLHLNVSGGGAFAEAMAKLYFPWEVRDTVARPALLAFLEEMKTLKHRVPFISWHGGGWKVPFPPAEFRIFTMVREPVARFLSFHNTLLTHGDAPWVPDCVRRREGIAALTKVERSKANGNTFAVQVCMLEIEQERLKAMAAPDLLEIAKDILSRRYFMVGVMDYYDVSLLAACLLTGFDKVPLWQNKFSSAKVPGRINLSDLTAAEKQEIEALFAVDIELYHWIKQNFIQNFSDVFAFIERNNLCFELGK